MWSFQLSLFKPSKGIEKILQDNPMWLELKQRPRSQRHPTLPSVCLFHNELSQSCPDHPSQPNQDMSDLLKKDGAVGGFGNMSENVSMLRLGLAIVLGTGVYSSQGPGIT